jgi:ribosomal protein S18 acetylase RimI-like enzyme
VAAIANEQCGLRALSEEVPARWLSRPGSDAELDFVVVDAPDGSLAGYVRIHCDPPRNEPIFMGGVAAGHQARGLGTSLCRYVEARAAQLTAETHGTVTLLGRVASGCSDGDLLLKSLGYTEERHLLLLRAEASEVLRRLAAPTHFPITEARTEDGPEVYSVLSESFIDHWGTSWPTYETWAHDGRGVWLAARSGETIVGVLVVAPHLVEDPDSAQFVELGVRPPWRRHGVSRALLRRGIELVSVFGRRRVGLLMDGESTTGAKQLFDALGFHAAPRFTYWSKRLRL